MPTRPGKRDAVRRPGRRGGGAGGEDAEPPAAVCSGLASPDRARKEATSAGVKVRVVVRVWLTGGGGRGDGG